MLGESLAAQPEHETISVRRIETSFRLFGRNVYLLPQFWRILALILSFGLELLGYTEPKDDKKDPHRSCRLVIP